MEREIDGGLQTLALSYPCLITCDLRLNEPRYIAIKQIMAAKKKKVEKVKLESLELSDVNRLTVEATTEPKVREGGILVETVDELIDKLKNEAKVI